MQTDNKKAAIITIYGENNYGNRLQNYAVYWCFQKWGKYAETIVFRTRKTLRESIKSRVKDVVAKVAPNWLYKKAPNYFREKCFKKFTKTYIPTRYFRSPINKKILNKYDTFITGSDQVWNPCFGNYEKIFDTMFLTSISNEKKRCFSPSFGVEDIPERWKEKFSLALNTFPKLCAREQSGVEIIRKLTGRSALLMIDPTLMLDAKDWLKVANKVYLKTNNFILDYFLGTTPDKNPNYQNALFYKKALTRIKLLDPADKTIFRSGPSEFIYLIAQATLICTDSFHACVFSILFDKPFIVFRREDENWDMFTRITTLLELFDESSADIAGKIIHISPEKRDMVLNKKRKEVEEFFEINPY